MKFEVENHKVFFFCLLLLLRLCAYASKVYLSAFSS